MAGGTFSAAVGAVYTPPATTNGVWYPVKLSAIGTAIKAYLDSGAGLVQRVNGVDSTLATGRAGIYAGYSYTATTSMRWDDFSACASDTLSVTGLPTGWKADATDGYTTLAKTVSSGGTSTLDAALLFYGSAGVTLRIYDASDVQQGTQASVFGGDVWAYTIVIVPVNLLHTRIINKGVIVNG